MWGLETSCSCGNPGPASGARLGLSMVAQSQKGLACRKHGADRFLGVVVQSMSLGSSRTALYVPAE